MKIKSVLLVCCISLSFIGCNLKELDDLKNKNDLLVEENNNLKTQIQELNESMTELESECSKLSLKIKELENQNNDSINNTSDSFSLDVGLKDSGEYEVHDLRYVLDFEYGGFDTNVYALPKIGEPIYTIQTGDKVDVFKFIHVIKEEKDFIAVKTNGLEGFIKIGGNPYSNGNFEVSETILVDGVETTILKMKEWFQVSDGIFIKELPSEASASMHEITHAEGYEVYNSISITSDYKWVKMQIGDFIGWIPSDCLSVNRGGPTLNTPEEYIYFDLIGGNLI